MLKHSLGLTDVYNGLHDPNCSLEAVVELRMLQRQLDQAVLRAYGWDDLNLEHYFFEVPHLPESDRVRFTISEAARVEVLRRLSELNSQRYEEEVVQGLHDDAKPSTSTRAPRAGRTASATATAQPSLDFGTVGTTSGNDTTPSTAILGFLSAHDGWHAKADVLAATGITDGQWNAAIANLISDCRVERQGEKRGARYRIQSDHLDDHHEEAP